VCPTHIYAFHHGRQKSAHPPAAAGIGNVHISMQVKINIVVAVVNVPRSFNVADHSPVLAAVVMLMDVNRPVVMYYHGSFAGMTVVMAVAVSVGPIVSFMLFMPPSSAPLPALAQHFDG
jgi:hypothetical protein